MTQNFEQNLVTAIHYDTNLTTKLKEIVAKDLEPESMIHVSKQKQTKRSTPKAEQLNLFDEPDNGPSLD